MEPEKAPKQLIVENLRQDSHCPYRLEGFTENDACPASQFYLQLLCHSLQLDQMKLLLMQTEHLSSMNSDCNCNFFIKT